MSIIKDKKVYKLLKKITAFGFAKSNFHRFKLNKFLKLRRKGENLLLKIMLRGG